MLKKSWDPTNPAHLPSSQGVTTVVMKNCGEWMLSMELLSFSAIAHVKDTMSSYLTCEPFVLGPALAMDRYPGAACFRLKFSSSNFPP